MRQLAFLLMMLSTSIQAHAVSMGQVIGRVLLKETNQPVAFAELIFENKMDRVVVVANEYGHYYADHIPTGNYQISINFNGRTFIMKKVQVYDGYTSEIEFSLSNDSGLPLLVELEKKQNLLSSVTKNDITLKNSNNHQPTQNLADALSSHAGVDVRNGKLYVKGSSQVKFFVDGTPVMGQPTIGRVW